MWKLLLRLKGAFAFPHPQGLIWYENYYLILYLAISFISKSKLTKLLKKWEVTPTLNSIGQNSFPLLQGTAFQDPTKSLTRNGCIQIPVVGQKYIYIITKK